MSKRDYYEVLGVDKNASDDELKKCEELFFSNNVEFENVLKELVCRNSDISVNEFMKSISSRLNDMANACQRNIVSGRSSLTDIEKEYFKAEKVSFSNEEYLEYRRKRHKK